MSDQPFRQQWAFILAIIVILGISALKLYLSIRGTPVSSDNALPVILFESLKNGLHSGWYFAPDNYLMSDFPFYVASCLLIGPSASVLWGTAITVSFFGLMTIALAINRIMGQREAVVFAILCSVPLVLGNASYIILSTPFLHVMTIGSSIWLASQIIADTIDSPAINWPKLTLYVILGSFIEMSDPFFLFICIAPLMLVGIWYAVSRNNKTLGLLKIIIFTGGTTVFAILEIHAVESIPNIVWGPHTEITSLKLLGFHINLAVESLLTLVGANFRDGCIGSLLGATKIVAITYFAAYTIRKYWTKNLKNVHQAFIAYLEIMNTIILFAFIFSVNPVDIYSDRYLFPAIIGVLILVSIAIVDRFRKYGRYLPLILFLSVAYTAVSMGTIQNNTQPSPYAQIARELQAHHIQYGYSGYDHATSVTFASGGAVRIRAMVTTESGKVQPYHWVSNSQWYQPGSFTGPTCLILDSRLRGLSADGLEARFGKPSQVFSVQGMKVIVWPYNISERFD